MTALRHMGNFNLTVKNHRKEPHHLMDRLNPLESPEPLKQLGAQFPVKIVHRTVGKLVPIKHLYNLNLRQHRFL